MSDLVIQIEKLGKSYSLFHRAERNRGLRHVLTDAFKAPFRKLNTQSLPAPEASRAASKETFWALEDVSFHIKKGQVVGIIGRNGAGKSTLLKILSRITAPTTGRVKIRGRVASLLEVGTGFHPELTGRENIFLNGAILGMGRGEIRRKFDEIVTFAEVERFLDTPVKRYSSGMYMRLAFAVAAHLEPEILIVDEVLAVGDVQFQQKCLGKMGEVASKHGRTVLFVSHNLAAVQKLCTECKLLEAGKLAGQGAPAKIVRQYLDLYDQKLRSGQPVNGEAGCEVRLRILDSAGQPTWSWRYGEPLQIDVTLVTTTPLWKPAVDLAFYDDRRTRLFALQSDKLGQGPERIDSSWTASFRIENPGLTLTEISMDVGVREGASAYLSLVEYAGRLSIDHASVPSAALDGCLLFPPTSHAWKPGEN